MSFTAKLNRIRKVLGKDEHFQREKNPSFRTRCFVSYSLLSILRLLIIGDIEIINNALCF